MNTFKEGDRVTHKFYGTGTVDNPYSGTGYATVRFDTDDLVMADTSLLTPVPVPFKIGDRVSHPLHRNGTVDHYSEHSGLYTVDIGGGRAYFALEHQITPTVPEPTYHICIEEITGAAHVPGKLTAKEVAEYIADSVNWRVVQEIKITKEG